MPLHKYLQADGERRVKVVAKDDPDGMRSITLVKVKDVATGEGREPGPAFTLLEVTIKTGRTHQIRVHLASQGHPIAGDDKYGDFELNKALAEARAQAHVPARLAVTVQSSRHRRAHRIARCRCRRNCKKFADHAQPPRPASLT